jgi:hypothetical protein
VFQLPLHYLNSLKQRGDPKPFDDAQRNKKVVVNKSASLEMLVK